MKAFSVVFLCLFSLSSFADSPAISAQGHLSRRYEKRLDSRYPVGFWVSRSGNEFQISRRGNVETNVALAAGFGTPTRLQFDQRLESLGRGRFTVKGYVPIRYVSGFNQFVCNFPVRLNIREHDGEWLDVEIQHPQSVGVDAFGRCLYWGITSTRGEFDRD